MNNAHMSGPSFTLSAGTRSDPATITANGDIDLANVDAFGSLLEEAAQSAPSLIVDLRSVTYCDSAAMRALFSKAATTSLTLLTAASAPITTLLEISGLDRITTVSKSD